MVVLLYFSLRGKAYDFQVFYRASELTLALDSPWEAVIDPIHLAFMNGPLTALLISPLGIFSENLALLITRTLSISLIPCLTYHLLKFFTPHLEVSMTNKNIWLASTAALFTFPVRANLEYGQFYIIFLTIAVYALRHSQSSEHKSLFFSGLLIGICCDYKPQSFLFFAILIGFTNKYIFFGGCLTVVLSAFSSVLLTGEIPFKVWVEVILARLKGGSTPEQMHIYTLHPRLTLLFVVAAVFVILVRFKLKTESVTDLTNSKVFFLFVAMLLSPWMHSSDLVLVSIFIVGIVVFNHGLNLISSLGLGALLVWSDRLIINIILLTLMVFLIVIWNITSKTNIFSLWIIFVPQAIFYFVPNENEELQILHRHLWGLASLVSALLLSAFSKSPSSRDLRR
jgi:hypothetical protein